jgi:phosphoribosylformylglycinamidine (FGAM) synthase-like enzyme
VESTVIGTYTDSGKLHITYKGVTCAYVDLDLLTKGFPQWEFDAEWQPPALRGLTEPVLGPQKITGSLIGHAGPAQHLFQGVGRPPV